MKNSGFTFIELLIVVSIILIFGMLLFNFVNTPNTNYSYGIGGFVETRCINGYKFVISNNYPRQIMDEYGKGVKCE